jgi:hypothetical protein
MWKVGSGVWGLGSGVWGLGSGIWGLGYGVWGLGSGIWGLGYGVWGGMGIGLIRPIQSDRSDFYLKLWLCQEIMPSSLPMVQNSVMTLSRCSLSWVAMKLVRRASWPGMTPGRMNAFT